MDLRKLKTLIDLVSESNISELEITEAEGKVRIVKSSGVAPAMVAAPMMTAVASAPLVAPTPAAPMAASPTAAEAAAPELPVELVRQLEADPALAVAARSGLADAGQRASADHLHADVADRRNHDDNEQDSEHTFEIEFLDPGVQAFAFTFG